MSATREPIAVLENYTGIFLVAAPTLRDPNFARTAVLVAEHGEDGAFGLVLNRPLDTTTEDLARALELEWQGRPSRIFGGGPVMEESVWMLCEEKPSSGASREIRPGIFLTADADAIRGAILAPRGRTRLFLGYSGWAPSQLESEISDGSWLLAPLERDRIFHDDPERVWNETLHDLGLSAEQYVPSSGLH